MKKTYFILFLMALFVGAASVYGGTIYVPDNYSTIQGAIDAAKDGDVIIVRNETYYENLVINKSITLRSENGPGNCIIDGNNSGNVIEINADGVIIEGFRIRNSGRSWPYAGIKVNSDSNNITNNNISNNECGIYVYNSSNNGIIDNNILNNSLSVKLRSSSNNSIIGNNISNNRYDGIYVYNSINNCIVDNSITSNNEYGIYVYNSSNNSIVDNSITSNNRYGI
ncbi:right-handed parallel beta-helix repeat-containing protein [Methanothermococcus sp. SCGC AD-155-C09]|nr:right-handed parallel beta-helix repeat-containing protein [Methanothermococcus sp. SCGC AD-155-C09]